MELNIDYDDQKELENMPPCAEKLLVDLSVNLSQNHDKDFDKDGLLEELKKLKKNLTDEGLLEVNRYEINKILTVIKNALQQNNISLAFGKLKELHTILRDLNIPKLLRLIKENNDALDVVNEKNIYLFIGLTGSGNNT
jgi:hypothetical protein